MNLDSYFEDRILGIRILGSRLDVSTRRGNRAELVTSSKMPPRAIPFNPVILTEHERP
jgi:hypothetical protein